MRLLLFGGQSTSNIEWLEQISSYFINSNPQNVLRTHKYLAWSTESNENEAEQIKKEISHAKSCYKDKVYDVVMAKSFGCLLNFESGVIPLNSILIGPPTKPLRALGYDLVQRIKAADVSTLVIVNSNDDLVDIQELQDLSQDMPHRLKVITIHGDSHSYPDVQHYAELIEQYVH